MPKADANKKTWEDADVPAVCEDCLGPNPYVRMTKEKQGEECKLCTRPFTVFRWVPNKGARYKRTLICLTCARQKNACQSCMLDLTYGLPLAIRDAALKMAGDSALEGNNAIIKQYIAQNLEENEDLGADMEARTQQAAHELLKRVAEGMRGRREEAVPKALKAAQQKAPSKALMEDVQRIVSKLPLQGSIAKRPKDEKIKSFFIMGVDDDLSEHALREYFSRFGGSVTSLVCVHRARAAFVTFDTRETAEAAADALKSSGGKFAVGGSRLRAVWGKPRSLGTTGQEQMQVGQIIRKFLRSSAGGAKGGSTAGQESVPVAAPPGGGAPLEYKSQQSGGYEA